jgi:hypothetical protein
VRAAVAVGWLLAAACATGGTTNPFDASQGQDTISLRVENRNLHDVTLYLLRGKERQELGSVRGGALQYVTFSWPAGQPLDMDIQLDTGERYRLPPFPYLGAGQIQLTVAGVLRRSTFVR